MDVYEIGKVILESFRVTIFVLLIISILLMFKNKEKIWSNKSLTKYLIISVFFEILGHISFKLFQNNLFTLPLYGLVEYFFWTRFFIDSRFSIYKKIKYVDTFFVLIVFVDLFTLFFVNEFLLIPSRSIAYLLLIGLLLYSFVKDYKVFENTDIPIFYSVFLFSSINCAYYLILNFSIYYSNEIISLIWYYYSLILYVFYVLLIYFQWKVGKMQRQFLRG